MARDLFLAAYDIRRPTRLRKMLQILKDYASGGQKSAFECYLSGAEKKELIGRVQGVMDDEEDSFFLIRLTGRNAVYTMGVAIKPIDEEFTYLG